MITLIVIVIGFVVLGFRFQALERQIESDKLNMTGGLQNDTEEEIIKETQKL